MHRGVPASWPRAKSTGNARLGEIIAHLKPPESVASSSFYFYLTFSDFTKVQGMQGDRSSNLRVSESLIVQHSTDETSSKS